MWNIVQIKTLYQYFSAQICLLCSFLLLFNIFNIYMRRGNKNILLPLIRLQNKAVRTLNMTKLKLHYSILNTKF